MAILSFFKNAIKMNDLFYATEMLRYDKELEYRSFTGGLFSLAIIVAVIVGFASMILDTLSLSSINFVEIISKDQVPTLTSVSMQEGSNFMMAVELWGVNMTAPVRYFDVLMIQLSTSDGQRDYNYELIPLQGCTKQHWAGFPQILSQFDSLSMSNWLCPPINTTINLSGDFTSNIYQYVNISVNPCIDWLDPSRPCASKSQVADVFNGLSDAIRFKIYYTNPLINAGQKEYKSYFLESSNYISFGATIGGEAYIYAADYQISNDFSIWPYTYMVEDDGILIEERMVFHPYTTFQSTYACYLFVKSPTSYAYQREVQKISTVFSFIGGLISALSAALFILKVYNNLAYEVSVAICIFEPNDDKDINFSNLSMNFLTFIKFNFYQLLRKIGKTPDWPQTSFLVECQEEIIRQLDVKALVKRVIFMEYCMTNLFEDYQLEGLQIQKPKSPKDICKIRQKCESLDTFQENHLGQTEKNSFKSDDGQSEVTLRDKSKDKSKGKLAFDLKCTEMISPVSLSDKSEPERAEVKIKSLKNKVLNSILIHDEKISYPLQFNERIQNHNRVSDVHAASNRISKNLEILKKNAEEGNALSKRIWNQIQANPNEISRLKHRVGKIV